MADGSRGEMTNVDGGAHRALARLEIVPDRVERGVLHGEDHHRGREHWRQNRVFELIGEVLGPHLEGEAALGSEPDGTHETVLRRVFPENAISVEAFRSRAQTSSATAARRPPQTRPQSRPRCRSAATSDSWRTISRAPLRNDG